MTAAKRKLWAVGFRESGVIGRQRSKTAAYDYVASWAADWAVDPCGLQHMTVYVDERDGQGWQTYEHIDLAELAAASGVSGVSADGGETDGKH